MRRRESGGPEMKRKRKKAEKAGDEPTPA